MGTLKTLNYVQTNRLDALHRLSISGKVLREAWLLVARLHCHHLQTKPASYAVLSSLGR